MFGFTLVRLQKSIYLYGKWFTMLRVREWMLWAIMCSKAKVNENIERTRLI